MILRSFRLGLLIVRVLARLVAGLPQRLPCPRPRHPARFPVPSTALAVVRLCVATAAAYSPAMWVSVWNRLMARQELLLLSAVTAMVLFAVVTIPVGIQH